MSGSAGRADLYKGCLQLWVVGAATHKGLEKYGQRAQKISEFLTPEQITAMTTYYEETGKNRQKKAETNHAWRIEKAAERQLFLLQVAP